MKSLTYEVRAEPDVVLRSLGASIAPKTSSSVLYVDEVDTELVGLTEGPGRVSVRRRRGLAVWLWSAAAASWTVFLLWRSLVQSERVAR